ncbi:GNAT family N-acetyltransferase [Halalkalibacter akibai]|uniref:Putative acetyltransferase n=1 Tax=Halalkalibacter akibai (strain ATCC 43226 / DSM 21942 / CIP 109018 / JCM 9157 / 1139) TaxID=1236973 RepID=W4QTB3_HALA3|nr:GNAT family N-acetyltransferase [Halalkalibacter akibai]GAE35142.1 putative acetyltransferase [Halalkalibacter akibai JCM 9157]
MTQITYSSTKTINAEQLAALFTMSGIKRPIDDLARLQRMIDHADLIITAWDGPEIVGIARAITDFSYCCYLSDLAVHKEYQQNGIGKNLIKTVQEHISNEVVLILLASETAMNYYPNIGFKKIENGFKIPRVR